MTAAPKAPITRAVTALDYLPMRPAPGAVAAGAAVIALVGAVLSPVAAGATAPAGSHPGAVVTPPTCPASTTGATGFDPPEKVLLGSGQARVFAMHHKTVLNDAASYGTIYASLDRAFRAQVDPYRATDHPNLVVFNELNGLTYGVEGSRGALARSNASTLTFIDQNVGVEGSSAIGIVALNYLPQIAYYNPPRPGFPATTSQPAVVERLFTAITDTMVRSVVENAACLAKAHGVYVMMGAPLPIVEGAACTGAYAGWPACPGWHRSTSVTDIAALQDPDLAPASYVYVADTPDIDNVELVFAPNGELYDMQPKVNITTMELQLLGWHQAGAATIHAIPLFGADATRFPSVQMGVGISLDAFENGTSATPCPPGAGGQAIVNPYPQFNQCLDSKGVTIYVQPEWNAAAAGCMSWTDFAEGQGATSSTACGAGWSWQPLSWMRSAWFTVQGRNPDGSFRYRNFRYAINPFIVGHLFDVAGDGQTAIFSRYDPRAPAGWYAGDSSVELYRAAGAYTDRGDNPAFVQFEGPQPGFLELTSWVIPESAPAAKYRKRTPELSAGDPGSLQSCEHGLAPGSGVTTGPCAEDNYHSTALVADLDLTYGPPPVTPAGGSGLPGTTTALIPWLFLLGGAAVAVLLRAGRRRVEQSRG